MKTTVLTFALGCPDDGYPLSFIDPEHGDMMACCWCKKEYTLGSTVKLIGPDVENPFINPQVSA